MSAAVVYCATCGAVNPPDATVCFACGNPPSLAPKSLLRQRYRLLALIGKGGFGAVYLAEDMELGNRKVAVKEMSQRGLTPEEVEEATRTFRNEALLLAGLTHPNLPRIYEQFSEGGRWYLVMDFIEGEPLEARLSRTPGGRLPVLDVLKIGLQLCTVLDYLHQRQPPIIFRDLKPANIMVTQSGDIYLIDFGIACHFKPGQSRDTVAFGSAGYAAPEQYGKAQTTTQSDIYSLGATLHQLLSGSDPADNPFLFAPLHLAEPRGLEELIAQMLEVHQSKRPASMALIKQDFQRMTDELVRGQKEQKPAALSASLPMRGMDPSQRLVAMPAPVSIRSAPALLLIYRGHTDRVNTIGWSPDGKSLASAGNDQTVQLWESASGQKLRTFPETDRVHALAWSPDGAYLAWVSQGKVVHLWKVDTGEFSTIALPGLNVFNVFLALAWSPDSTRLAAGGLGKTVEVWEVKTGKHLLTYSGHRRFFEDLGIYSVAWSPDGAWIASASTNGIVQVWEVSTGHMRCTFYGDQLGYLGQRGAIAWSPDGQSLASAGERATVSIHDAATGEQRLLFSGHSSAVKRVAWSPDGRYLASGSSDRTVRIWDVAAAREVLIYADHQGEVTTIAWSPDGTCLASAGADRTVHIWQVR